MNLSFKLVETHAGKILAVSAIVLGALTVLGSTVSFLAPVAYISGVIALVFGVLVLFEVW